MYRFVDAGDTKLSALSAGRRPQSVEARSRGKVGGRLVGELYGDLMRGPVRWGPLPWSEAAFMPARGSGRESEKSVSAGS